MPVVQPAVSIRISERAKFWEVSGILGSAVPIGPSAVPVPHTGSADTAIGSSDQGSPEVQRFLLRADCLGCTETLRVGSSDWNIGSAGLCTGSSGTSIGSAD